MALSYCRFGKDRYRFRNYSSLFWLVCSFRTNDKQGKTRKTL